MSSSEEFEEKRKSTLERILDKKAIILILIGLAARIFMLFYFYLSSIDPSFSWGDVGLSYNMVVSIFDENFLDIFNLQYEYPPLSIFLLSFLKTLSFNTIEIFVFYSFLLELSILAVFYLVLKQFPIKNYLWVFALFVVNPFVFLNNVFSLEKCGYPITDFFFWLFLLGALYNYPKENKAFFYLFSGFAMCVKWFTLPAAIYFFIKFLIEKDWNELKKMIIYLGIPIILFLFLPIFYMSNYLDLYLYWLTQSGKSHIAFISKFPLIGKLIIFGIVFLGYLVLRIRKATLLEITFVSIIVMFSIMFWSRLYLRYLTPLVMYGHLMPKKIISTFEFSGKTYRFHKEITNHTLTYIISIFACLASFLIIVFVFQSPII